MLQGLHTGRGIDFDFGCSKDRVLLLLQSLVYLFQIFVHIRKFMVLLKGVFFAMFHNFLLLVASVVLVRWWTLFQLVRRIVVVIHRLSFCGGIFRILWLLDRFWFWTMDLIFRFVLSNLFSNLLRFVPLSGISRMWILFRFYPLFFVWIGLVICYRFWLGLRLSALMATRWLLHILRWWCRTIFSRWYFVSPM